MMKLSFKQRILGGLLLSALVPVVLVSGIALYTSFHNSSSLAEAALSGVQDSTRLRTQDYFGTVLKQVAERANSPLVHNAMKDFSVAETAFDATAVPYNEAQLKARYTYQQEKTKYTKPEDVAGWLPTDAREIALQHLYISSNTNPIGEKQKLDDAGDGSEYSKVHAKYHPSFRAFVNRFGLYDFFLIDATSKRILYSNFKEIDFQTSVKDGPLADTALSKAVRQALASTDKDAVFMSDIEAYMPSYNEGAIFVAAPIIEDGTTIGAVAIQLPTDQIGGVFTPLKHMGTTVDGFIAGPDLKFRTPQTAETGKVGEVVNPQLGSVLADVFKTGQGGIKYYLGEDGGPMTGSFGLIDLNGVKWVMVVGQDNAEMMASTYRQMYLLAFIVAATIIILVLFGLWLANSLGAPVLKLGRGFMASSDKVGRSNGMVGDAVSSMIAASEETSAQSTVVRRNSGEAAGYVGSVSSAVEELNISIHDISQSISETNVLVDDAVSKAQHTNEVVRKLGEASGRITEVVGLINDLAAQTNLLALNAAIEAARAGDAGRGFAVVADEVKKLASHTAQATVDIGAQIHEIQDVTRQSMVALQTVVEAIHRIRDNATAVSAAVEEQSGVAKQISTSVRDAATRVQQVDENMTGIEQAANDTGVAADQVNLAVGEVQGALGEMKNQIEGVLKDMGVNL